jgi:hypothetical protein
MVTATAAATDRRHPPDACMSGGDSGDATPEKRKVEGRADTAAVAAKGGISHSFLTD